MLDQQDYERISETSHKVGKDVVRSLTSINFKIDELKKKHGSDLIMVITLSAHLPKRKLLPLEHSEEHPAGGRTEEGV